MLMVGALLRFGSVATWVFHIIACMGGCFGCNTRLELISTLNESLKGKNSLAKSTSKATMLDDFWTTSTCDMDNNAVQSRGSISSTSTLTQIHDALDCSISTNPTEFVNHGLLLWNQNRQIWVGNKKKPGNKADQTQEPKLNWNATYDDLLSSDKPFRQPIPLCEMVDFLVDVWEQEGLYD